MNNQELYNKAKIAVIEHLTNGDKPQMFSLAQVVMVKLI